jgi:hypothetical protein
MTRKAKPQRAGRGVVEEETEDEFNFLNLTTRPLKTQLFGVFDRESKSAVILLPGEARP